MLTHPAAALSPDPILVADNEGRILEVNPAASRISGFPPAELVGRYCHELLHPDDHALYREGLAQLLSEGVAEGYELRVLTVSGTYIWINWSSALLEQGDRFITIGRDITQQKLAQQQLARHQAELEQLVEERTRRLMIITNELQHIRTRLEEAQALAHVGSWEWDFASDTVTWSAELHRIFGLSAEEFGGNSRAVLERIYPDDRAVIERRLVNRENDVPGEIDYRIIRPDGSIRHLRGSRRALRDETGEVTGMSGVAQDITAHKLAELALFEQSRALETANRELESFSYSVSHDLRSPLRTINACSHFLRDEYGESLDGTARGYLERINEATTRMQRLIDGLLDMSRLVLNDEERAIVDLSALTEEIVGELRATESERRVHLLIEPQLTVYGNPPLLRALLANLLGNAWKFTRSRDNARIEFGVTGDKETPVYYVRDNGIGIASEDIATLFQPFHRLNLQEEYDGSGIGLTVVQRVVRHHGGRVWAEGTPGAGATFFFTLWEPGDGTPLP